MLLLDRAIATLDDCLAFIIYSSSCGGGSIFGMVYLTGRSREAITEATTEN
ncbi:MAG: hypothetical protein ACRC62_03410 [Microcoleus sp.]